MYRGASSFSRPRRICEIVAAAAALVSLAGAPPAVAADAEAARLHDRLTTRVGDGVEAVARIGFGSTADGWVRTGLKLGEEQAATVFVIGGDGMPTEGREGDLHDLLWIRLGASDVLNLGSDAFSFSAWEAAELEIGIRPGGARWADCSGRLDPASAGADEAVDLQVVIAAWEGDAGEGLAALPADTPVTTALQDLRAAPELPAGFRPVCHLPHSRVFHAWREGDRRGIRGLAEGSAGIVKKAVDLPFGDDAEISFAWRYDTIPALGPETDARSHDYSSIAVEFSNGQDITWIRSRHLAAGTVFRCPLPWWDRRETHIVLQGGEEGIGEWQEHTRSLGADYDRAVGGERPARIVGVWFISVGVFGDTAADTTYSDVVLRSGDETVEIFE
ncbi:MAG: DUF3047 domain-containing protein [Thermoanaerobaculia bacterium]|nr:DUF3047 domain-containing protein [Thermoanaerobaculia bacterium]